MKKKQRLLGIDLCRGIASYAVILVHSGDKSWGLPINNSTTSFRLFFYFAVPFFLATSFYFMTRRRNLGLSIDFWKSRVERVIIPYAIWSIAYILIRASFFLISNKLDRLNNFLHDPLSIIFFGGSSYQLYFLPLLLVGTSLILFSDYFSSKSFKTWILILFTICFVIINQTIITSGNGFQLTNGIAFERLFKILAIDINNYPVARIFSVYVVWILRCLPYFFIAIILNRFLLQKDFVWFSKSHITILNLALFLIINICGGLFIPRALKEVIIAYSLLLFGISVSRYLGTNNWLISNLGKCSFGIYLIHPILMNITKPLLGKIYPELINEITITSILLISLASFLSSWIAVCFISKNKFLAKYMFGI